MRNLLNIHDENELDLAEAELSRASMMLLYEQGFMDFSTQGIKTIHNEQPPVASSILAVGSIWNPAGIKLVGFFVFHALQLHAPLKGHLAIIPVHKITG